MKNDGNISNPDIFNEGIISIVVFHHYDNWLNEKILNLYGGHATSYNYLDERCHIFLSGHIHAVEIELPKRTEHEVWHSSVGTV